MKAVLSVGAVLALVVPATANLLVNGSFDVQALGTYKTPAAQGAVIPGWGLWDDGGPIAPDTEGNSRWQTTSTCVSAPYAISLQHARGVSDTACAGSMGIYQVFNTVPGVTYALSGRFYGSKKGQNDVTVLLVNGDAEADPSLLLTQSRIYNELTFPPGADDDEIPEGPEVIGHWAYTDIPSDKNNWASFLGSNVATGNKMTVVFRSQSASVSGDLQTRFDDVVVTPEPVSALLFGLVAIPLLRRRRA